MVFQDYALYPHMTVRQNLTFNLHNRRVPLDEIEKRLTETAGMLGIERHLTKYPAQLSGGERQRVALGRALIRKPRVFLMDEPLSNLDLKLREAMRLELGRLHRRLGITVVYVTHDQAEAMTLSTADRDHEQWRSAAGRSSRDGLLIAGQQFRCEVHRQSVYESLPRCSCRRCLTVRG